MYQNTIKNEVSPLQKMRPWRTIFLKNRARCLVPPQDLIFAPLGPHFWYLDPPQDLIFESRRGRRWLAARRLQLNQNEQNTFAIWFIEMTCAVRLGGVWLVEAPFSCVLEPCAAFCTDTTSHTATSHTAHIQAAPTITNRLIHIDW